MLWILGGVMDTDEHGNRPIHEEVLVTIAVPFQHIVIYGIVFFVSSANLLPSSVLELIIYYNTAIFVFNLLPIWPLDGGKILFLCLSSMLPYRKAYHSVIIFSIALCILLLILLFLFFLFLLIVFFFI